METPEQADAIIAARAARSARAAGPKFTRGDDLRYFTQADRDKLIADVAQDEKHQALDRKPGWFERLMLYNRIYGKLPYEIATGDDDKVAASLESSDNRDDDGSGSKKKPVVLESSDDDDFGGFRRKGAAKRVPRKRDEKSREPRGEKRSRLGGFEFDSGSWPGPRKPASVKPGREGPRGAKRGSGRGPSRLDDFEFL